MNSGYLWGMESITWQEFERIEMRVGTIIEVSDFPEAQKPAYRLHIDFGAYGIKKSSAQITDLYDKESLIGKQIIAVVNFPPKQIGKWMSECLVLGLVGDANGVILLQPERPAENGLQVG